MNTVKKCRLILSSLPMLLAVLFLNSVSVAADSGKNGKIAFQANYTGSVQIYTVNPDGTDLFQVTNLPATSNIFALWPDFSPDGKRIVFPHDMTGALELYVVNPDGTNFTQITHDSRDHIEPRWSPDGTHIVFGTAGKYGFLNVIGTIRADGTDFRMLTTPVWDSLGVVYTADGRHIIFSTQLDGYVAALWIMDTDGKHVRRLTDPRLTASIPDVSPDGKQVVFNNRQNSPGLSTIFKMNLQDNSVIRLTSPERNAGLPVFSPDGKKLLFVSDQASPGSLDTWVMDADGSHQRLLIKGGAAENWGVQP